MDKILYTILIIGGLFMEDKKEELTEVIKEEIVEDKKEAPELKDEIIEESKEESKEETLSLSNDEKENNEVIIEDKKSKVPLIIILSVLLVLDLLALAIYMIGIDKVLNFIK